MSHRGEWLLIGFHPSGDAGVDLEWEDDALDVLQLARDHYSAGEYAALAAMAQPGRLPLFFRLWCAKEAVLKATGRGIAEGLQQPDFAPVLAELRHDGVAAQVRTLAGRMAQVATRRLKTEKGQRFCAALAILI